MQMHGANCGILGICNHGPGVGLTWGKRGFQGPNLIPTHKPTWSKHRGLRAVTPTVPTPILKAMQPPSSLSPPSLGRENLGSTALAKSSTGSEPWEQVGEASRQEGRTAAGSVVSVPLHHLVRLLVEEAP